MGTRFDGFREGSGDIPLMPYGGRILRVEFGDPPVVFAGRIGGDVGQGFGIGRPIELVDVEVGGALRIQRRRAGEHLSVRWRRAEPRSLLRR